MKNPRAASTAPTALKTHLALFAVQILFGLWPVAGAAVMGCIPPSALIGLRTLLAAPILLLLFRPPIPTLRQLPMLALLGFLGVSANQLLYAFGLERCGPINAALLTLLIPAETLLLARVMGYEVPSMRRMAGVGIALCGAALMMRPAAPAGPEAVEHPQAMLGNLLIIANTLCYAGYLVLGRRTAQVMGSQAMVSWVFVLGALEALPLTAPALATAPFAVVPPWAWLSVAFIVIGATVGTYALNAYALARAESSLVALYIYLQPLVSTTASALVLGRGLTSQTALAGLVIAVGVFFSSGVGRKP